MKLSKSKIYLVPMQGDFHESKFIGKQDGYFEFETINKKYTLLIREDAAEGIKEKE